MDKYALLTAAVLFSIDSAAAIDGPKWANQSPELRDWFNSLRSPNGFPCCSFADGTKVDDPDYRENPDGSYEVNVNSMWVHVDKDKVLEGTNKIGYAVFWGHPERDLIYCFMPGARG